MGSHRPHFETHPVVEMRLLRDAGLFSPFGPASITIHHHIPYRVTHSERGRSLFIEFIIDGGHRSQFIELDYSPAGYGERIRFKCPWTGRKCTKLHLYRGLFVSRSAHKGISVREGSPMQRRYESAARMRDRLLGRDGKGPARGLNRLRILLELAKTSFAFDTWPDLHAIRSRFVENLERKARPPAPSDRPGPKSTRAALAAGRPLRFVDEVPWMATKPVSLAKTTKPTVGSVLEDHLALDLKTLVDASRNTTSAPWAHSLVWRNEGDTVELELIGDWNDLAVHIADCCGRYLRGRVQRIGLIKTRGRLRFCCPASGLPCDVLYLRAGRFASRAEQNLEYRSQIGRHRPRRARPRSSPPTPGSAAATKNWEKPFREFQQPLPIPDDAPDDVKIRLGLWNRMLRGNRDATLFWARELRLWYPEMKRPEILSGYNEVEFAEDLKAAEAGKLFDSRGMKIPKHQRR